MAAFWQNFCYNQKMKKKHQNKMQDKDMNNRTQEQPDNLSEAEVMDNVPEADDENQTAEDIENAEMSEIESLAKQLAEEKLKVEKEKKEYMFLLAEFDNFRKRTMKEKSEIIRNAAENVLKNLLPIVDDFERGLDAIRDTDNAESVKEGMQLIYNKLIKYLESNGVKPIESNGADFDAEIHEAIAMVPAASDDQKGKVIDTPTKGYTINDKVLRHAKVVVAQ